MKRSLKIAALMLAISMSFGFASCSCFGRDDNSGLTAYDIAVRNGFNGTEQEWLDSLKGKDGAPADTVYNFTPLYEEAKENGFKGTYDEFMEKYFGTGSFIPGASADTAADKALSCTVSLRSDFSYISGYTYDRKGNAIPNESTATALGSGVIIELDKEAGNATVLTNFHTIYSPDDSDGWVDECTLYLYGREYEHLGIKATVIGASSTYDISLLKVENSDIIRESNVTAAEFAPSEHVAAGDGVIVVGNANGEGISVTEGIISVESEYITMISPRDEVSKVRYRVMRVDAAVNGGNSGGGLFDLNGKLIGIVNAKTVSTEIENMGYSIPAPLVQKIITNIKRNCDGDKKLNLVKSTIGVTIEIADSYSYYDEILRDTRIKETIKVSEVTPKSSADGNLKVGDVLKRIVYDGVTYDVERMHHATELALLYEAGKTVTYYVERDGIEIAVNIEVAAGKEID